MNSPAWVPWLVGGLAVALAVVSAIAGTLWARAQAVPLLRVAQLARELAERQRSLEDLLLRLERGSRPRGVELPSRPGMRGTEGDGTPAGSPDASPLSPALPHERREGRKEDEVNPTTSPLEGEVGGEAAGWGARGADNARSSPPTPALLHKGGGSEAESANRRENASPPARRVDPPHATPPGPTLIAVPDLASATREPVAPAPAEELQRRHGAAWELADAGATVEQIAAHLGLPVGHVTLILGLRRPLAGGPSGR